MTIGQFKIKAVSILKTTSPSPQLDTDVLLEFCLKLSKTALLLKRDTELTQQQLFWLNEAVEQRKTGLPIAYITGHKEFYGYDFLVTPDVLIPKPDTEILVEQAIETVISKMENQPEKLLTICDMCTGSGCIAIALMRTLIDVYKIPYSQFPDFTLVDISPKALEIARKNAEAANLPKDKIHFVRSNLFDQFTFNGGYSYDLILTNPPYIPHTMVDELLLDGRNEPRLALDGDIQYNGDRAACNDGLEIIRNLIPQAKMHLSPLGVIYMETGEYNAKATAFLAESHGFKTNIIKDLEGQDRVVQMY